MSENKVGQGTTFDYEGWVAEQRALKRPMGRVPTDIMYPVSNLQNEGPLLPPGDGEQLMLLGGSTTEVDEEIRLVHEGRSRPRKQICSCGHSNGSHEITSELSVCQTGRHWCTCRHYFPVLEVDDARHFKFSSSGSGPRHALSKGIRSLQRAGKSASLLVDKSCYRCAVKTERLVPVMFNSNNQPTHSVGIITFLFCDSCLDDVRISMPYDDPI
jgi:hypothetical protein